MIPSAEPLTELFLARSEKSSGRIASFSKVGGRWVGSTWSDARCCVEELALGLLEIGVVRGDSVAVLSRTRREWGQIDLATLAVGGITIGLYPTLTGPQIRQILSHSGARVIFVDEAAQESKVEAVACDLSSRVQIITLEPRGEGPNTITSAELRRRGAARRIARPEEFVRRVREAKPSDVVSTIYTSGTTGEPKGAMLTHANFHYVVHATSALIPYDQERTLIFLPLAHSLQRYASYLSLTADVEAYYAESLERVPDNLQEVRPSCFALVPRVLEKIHAKVLAQGAAGTPLRRKLFDHGRAVLKEVGALRRQGMTPRVRARLLWRAADDVVGARVRERLGGRVKFLGSGGAPLARDVHEFFEDIGVPVLEGWGLTETSAPACINTLDHRRIGTVGRPLPGTEVKIASDGEILVRGPGVFQGYYRDEAATKEAFDDEGWFKTGDIGGLGPDGFLSITDRKKDLIITSGGKNIAPQPIEGELRRDPLIAQAVVLGDRRPYLTALIGFDPELSALLAAENGLREDLAPRELAEVPGIKARIDAHLERVNAAHPSYEQIKRYSILPEEMTIESGGLTPTLKIKRRVIADRYAPLIDDLYRR